MVDGEGCSIRIAMLVYPHFTSLDLIGPQQVLASLPNTRIDLVAKTPEIVCTESGLRVLPDKTFEEAGTDYEILFVPGSASAYAPMEDGETLSFLAALGTSARYVTSVCTGSLILGAAGLLSGYRAASHWAFREYLSVFGAIAESGRVVMDGNRITGGGVTAGIDFGLSLAAILAGDDLAKRLELIMEYDPDPPFKVGHPDCADALTLAATKSHLAPVIALTAAAATRAGARLRGKPDDDVKTILHKRNSL